MFYYIIPIKNEMFQLEAEALLLSENPSRAAAPNCRRSLILILTITTPRPTSSAMEAFLCATA